MKWERNCTDILCCVLFAAFIVSMVGIAGYAFTKGDPYNLITPFDSDGRQCGKTDIVKNYPYKYMPELVSSNVATTYWKSVCVQSCP